MSYKHKEMIRIGRYKRLLKFRDRSPFRGGRDAPMKTHGLTAPRSDSFTQQQPSVTTNPEMAIAQVLSGPKNASKSV
jgi:hypothetical protein